MLAFRGVQLSCKLKCAIHGAAWFALAWFGACSPSLAQDIRIRVIDVGRGRPAAKKRIRVDFSNEDPGRRPGPMLRTGRDGVATLHLNPPPPPRFFVVLETGGYTSWSACSRLDFQVNQVLLSGKVAERVPCNAPGAQPVYTVAPGEVVVFTKRYSWWDRFKEFPR